MHVTVTISWYNRVNVPIVVQFVEVPMCFNGFKVSGRTISEYFNT